MSIFTLVLSSTMRAIWARNGITKIAIGLSAALSILVGCATPADPPPPTTQKVDFTLPGAAREVLEKLVTKADSRVAMMVEVTKESVSLSVLKDTQPHTFAYRDGKIAEVQSDMAYVDQATFDPNSFNLSDVGALFRAAAGISGSETNQRLQVVDYSSGRVMMSVSTNPESKTVFFNSDGSLMELLNFDTLGGITAGIEEVCGTLNAVLAIGITSDQMAYVDFPGSDEGVVVRRQRTERVPVTTITRSENSNIEPFSPELIHLEAIWQIVDSHLGTSETPQDAPWQVQIARDESDQIVMRFTIGQKQFETDRSGKELITQ